MAKKVLYRSDSEKVLAGVIGGLAEYLDFDVNMLRVLIAAFIVFSGIIPGTLVYILAALIVPTKPAKGKKE